MKIQDVLEIEFTVTLNGIMQSIAVKSRPGLLIVVCDKLCVRDNCLQTSEVTVLIVSMAISQSDNEKKPTSFTFVDSIYRKVFITFVERLSASLSKV